MVYGSSTEFPIEFLSSEVPEVMDSERPKVENIIPGEGVSLLNHHNLGSQQGQLYGYTQSTWTTTNAETL